MGLDPLAVPGWEFLSFRDKPWWLPGQGQPPPSPAPRVPLFYKRARHPAGSAVQLFHGCESHAGSPAWKTDARGEWTGTAGAERASELGLEGATAWTTVLAPVSCHCWAGPAGPLVSPWTAQLPENAGHRGTEMGP